MTDILDDLKQRLMSVGFNNPTIEKVVMEVRKDWAGERIYIHTHYEYNHRYFERNRNIIRDFKAGESITLLSRRYKLSKQRIFQIVKG
jgi:Mor family transcriptional regulator